MRQASKKYTSVYKKVYKTNTKHKQYGTSQLERDFASEYLDKLGLKYIYQYEAKEIGRFYDFAIIYDDGNELLTEKKDGIKCIKQYNNNFYRIEALIEVDGDWFHSNKELVKENEMNPMQKHNKKIDEFKNRYAAMKCIPLIRIWEHDIRKNHKEVENMLIERLTISKEKILLKENKKKNPKKLIKK